ncbi:hypothetical protein SAMN06296036_11336 [Pseudobacteriovorax antillogorgiicola]|uniref:Uncharacterized protein n=2 Tax=Pseudobacteriovorax antillogorgiicola TaxID=1513793 RepID=A0A1Y6C2S4_9BACT|nr:hypothetical protein EDD56_11437 [Pseudobacteriovorax antillogorgiicola]SMF42957.1 hypothetical protein SAMN06296036_11336 [Pseudobacteriovorax antillogorgiicola]
MQTKFIRWTSNLSVFAVMAFSQGGLAEEKTVNDLKEKYLDNVDQDLVKQQILRFTDLARELHEKNQSTASDACDKLETTWSVIEETAQSPDALVEPKSPFQDVVTFGNGSALRFWKIFSGWTKKDWAGDEGQDDEYLGNEIRPYREDSIRDTIRLTHRFGVNIKLSYVPLEGAKELGLTGHYAKRNDCVLGRLSSAVPTSVEDRFTPALSAKFFSDGAKESQVLIAQHDIGGQSWKKDGDGETIIDNNFYTHYLSNRLSFERGALAGVGAFSRFFYTAQYFSRNIFDLDYIFDPRELQANHLANTDVTGLDIAQPKGPRFVWLVAPDAERRDAFAAMAKDDLDFRRHFLAQNGKWKKGETALFVVYGSDTWTYNPEQEAKAIGKFVVNSDFLVSEAADVRLFFKHSIQFQKIPDAEGEESPYTQDYSFEEWTDELFTDDCRLGATAKEVYPKDLVKYYGKGEAAIPATVDFDQGSLDGTFLIGATIDPRSVRFSRDKEWCLAKFIKDRAKDPIQSLFERL